MWRIPISAATLGLAIAGFRFAGAATDVATAGTLPKDPCALLKPAEIQAALAPGATIGSGHSDSSGLPLGVGCTYSWGPRSSQWGETALTITVIDASKAWPGTSPETLEEGLRAKVKAEGANASVISGAGSAGAFTYEARSFNATAEAYYRAKNEHLAITYHEGGSLQAKDKIIALLKAAGARL